MKPGDVSKGGLAAAFVFAVLGIQVARTTGDIAFLLYGPAITLAIRSFFRGMTLGRGILVALGGTVLAQVAFVDPDDVSRWIIIALFGGGFLWEGFKRGKIQWRKKDRMAAGEAGGPPADRPPEESETQEDRDAIAPEIPKSRSSAPQPQSGIPDGDPPGEWTRLAIVFRNITLGFIAIYALIFFMSLALGDAWKP